MLFTTGYTANAIVHQGVLDPGVNFIGKPFSIAALAARDQEHGLQATPKTAKIGYSVADERNRVPACVAAARAVTVGASSRAGAPEVAGWAHKGGPCAQACGTAMRTLPDLPPAEPASPSPPAAAPAAPAASRRIHAQTASVSWLRRLLTVSGTILILFIALGDPDLLTSPTPTMPMSAPTWSRWRRK